MYEGTVRTRFFCFTFFICETYSEREHEIELGDLLFAALHELDEVREKHIPVSLTEAIDII